MTRPFIAVPGLALAVACGAGGGGSAPRDSTKPGGIAQSACERKLLTSADAAGVIDQPITGTGSIPGSPTTCEFVTAGASSVIVSLRPNGKASLAVWRSGHMPVAGTPVSGVGDEAVWVGTLDEMVAERNDLLCDIEVNGLAAALRDAPVAARQQAVGALCNKIFQEVR
jgi:hypothetical protein